MKDKDMNINSPEQEKKKPSRHVLRRGFYVVGLSVLIIAAAVFINIIAKYLSDNYPLNIDLTANKEFTISAENREYIEAVDKDITITVCADRDYYIGNDTSSYIYYLYTNNYILDSSDGKYLPQAIALLEEYAKINDHITIEFVDPRDTGFTEITQKYSSESITVGSYLVECTFKNAEGKEISNHKILGIDSLFVLTTSSDYMQYITGSNVETTVTSAIYAVTAEKKSKVTTITSNGASALTELQSAMEENNYEFTETTNLLTDGIPEDIDLAILAAPKVDFSPEELDVLQKFMENKGAYGKNLLFVGDASMPSLPNLSAFLEEWGFNLTAGTAWETDSYYYSPDDNATIFTMGAGTDYTAQYDSSYYYAANNASPISLAFDSNNNYVTLSLVPYQQSAVIRPSDADDDWTTDETEATNQLQMVALSSLSSTDENGDILASNMIAVSSLDYFSSDWLSYPSIANINAVHAIINQLTRQDSNDIYFTPKTVGTTTGGYTVTQAGTNTVVIIFVIAIPILIAVFGIIIWRRRVNL